MKSIRFLLLLVLPGITASNAIAQFNDANHLFDLGTTRATIEKYCKPCFDERPQSDTFYTPGKIGGEFGMWRIVFEGDTLRESIWKWVGDDSIARAYGNVYNALRDIYGAGDTTLGALSSALWLIGDTSVMMLYPRIFEEFGVTWKFESYRLKHAMPLEEENKYYRRKEEE